MYYYGLIQISDEQIKFYKDMPLYKRIILIANQKLKPFQQHTFNWSDDPSYDINLSFKIIEPKTEKDKDKLYYNKALQKYGIYYNPQGKWKWFELGYHKKMPISNGIGLSFDSISVFNKPSKKLLKSKSNLIYSSYKYYDNYYKVNYVYVDKEKADAIQIKNLNLNECLSPNIILNKDKIEIPVCILSKDDKWMGNYKLFAYDKQKYYAKWSFYFSELLQEMYPTDWLISVFFYS